ncbi:hypothetical protein N7457_005668 [Penicillium paradoxum]|uniref:uncharacterized protein n=1 Tax=Penicillium paradoxum TaxID=176176 RepID=UPI002546FD5F|nr:uncharacterized protein N7457_005668 [Penicillium paradoxum]KAJ5780508.1 hypothetical protein N7457_005668 [Penicillium paradoxum]
MVWAPYNVPLNAFGDRQRSSSDPQRPYRPVFYPHPPSMLTRPSLSLDNHLSYNPLQHSAAPIHPSYPMTLAPHHLERNPFDQIPTQYPSFEINGLNEPTTVGGHVSSEYSTTCNTPSASTPSMQEAPRPRASDYEVHTPGEGGRTHRPKVENLHGSYQCEWKDCTYRGSFSRKGVLMRHIETQHVSPRSFNCHICDRRFSRKDNMVEHLGRVHLERV